METSPIENHDNHQNLVPTKESVPAPELEKLMLEDNYEKYSKEDLIDKIRKLTCHVKQLRNVIRRDANEGTEQRVFKKARRERPFDFSRHPKRHVALKIAYLGWDYQGLAVQEDTDRTIEAFIFEALTKSKLIESRSTSNYHRCGRTDKGVSAFCQVISIDLRCKCTEGTGVITAHLPNEAVNIKISDINQEIDYCKILNAILPREIRVLAWAPVKPDFSARFDCKQRVYRYFIPVGGADLKAMQQAGEYLIGEHDYQNFCKIDTSAEKSTLRSISSVKITPCSPESSSPMTDPYQIVQLEIRGQSFLWHQIRCIVAVLILVGQGHEKPEIVRDLLDLSIHPKKPQYSMAMDYPLVLFDTDHGQEISEWIYSPDNIKHVIGVLQSIWAEHSLKAQMVLTMTRSVESLNSTEPSSDSSGLKATWLSQATNLQDHPQEQLSCLLMGTKTKVYKSLIDRPVCARTSASNNNSNSKALAPPDEQAP